MGCMSDLSEVPTETLLAELEQRGFAVEDVEEDENRPRPLTRAERRAQGRRGARMFGESSARFHEDLNAAVGSRSLSKAGRKWIMRETFAQGGTPAALRGAVEAWFERAA